MTYEHNLFFGTLRVWIRNIIRRFYSFNIQKFLFLSINSSVGTHVSILFAVKSPQCVKRVVEFPNSFFKHILMCPPHVSVLWFVDYLQPKISTNPVENRCVCNCFDISKFLRGIITLCVYNNQSTVIACSDVAQRCSTLHGQKKRKKSNIINLVVFGSLCVRYKSHINFIISKTILWTIGFQLSNHRDKEHAQYLNNYSKPIINVFNLNYDKDRIFPAYVFIIAIIRTNSWFTLVLN